MIEIELEDKSRSKQMPTERLHIENADAEKVSQWIKQVQENSKGFLALSKTDLIRFLIREHKDDLSPRELAQIRAAHYDPIRHMNWITKELKMALAGSDLAAVAMLQSEIKGIELTVEAKTSPGLEAGGDDFTPRSLPSPKRSRRKKMGESDSSQSAPVAENQADLQGQ